METMFYWSLALNFAFLCVVFYFLRTKKKTSITKLSDMGKAVTAENVVHPVVSAEEKRLNPSLRILSEKCEALLPEKDRGLIKVLVEKDNPQYPAILQVGVLKISIRRGGSNHSVLHADLCMDAVSMACYGYEGTARYIPVPSELEYIMDHRGIINVYLKALGLEQISEDDSYWIVDVETGWNTGWKRFNWSVARAYKELKNKFWLRTPDGCKNVNECKGAKLILLLKGWEHLFAEV